MEKVTFHYFTTAPCTYFHRAVIIVIVDARIVVLMVRTVRLGTAEGWVLVVVMGMAFVRTARVAWNRNEKSPKTSAGVFVWTRTPSTGTCTIMYHNVEVKLADVSSAFLKVPGVVGTPSK